MTSAWTELDLWELFEDKVDLLAVADAIIATRAGAPAVVPAPSRVRPTRLAATTALAVAALSALALWSPWQTGSGRSIFIERALAALGSGPVLHAVLEHESTAAGSGADEPTQVELWYAASTGEARYVVEQNGRVLDEVLIRGDGSALSEAGPVPGAPVTHRVDPALESFVSGYPAALRQGTVREGGSGIVSGRPVRWLEIPLKEDAFERVAVETATGKPLLVTQISNGREISRYKIVRIELRPREAADFADPSPSKAGGG